MNKDEKEIIRTNRRFIKENVSNIDKVADILYEKGILSMDNKEFVAVSCFFFITLFFFMCLISVISDASSSFCRDIKIPSFD